jgi:hypothetical protein
VERKTYRQQLEEARKEPLPEEFRKLLEKLK